MAPTSETAHLVAPHRHCLLGSSRARHSRRAYARTASRSAGTPGWAAATLVLAQAEAPEMPSDAAQRALDVLDRVPPSRLRATARTRLGRLEGLLAARPAEYVADLRERLRALPPPVDASGAASA
ncbi:hypothetical protein ACFYO0_25860 [Streptomyces sp. NPDC006365]|uniref:hypothetical protein n=1 Tax=Streptomyces sp. NPDC006365 TaxID=3364744 RepID=UPI00368894A0